MTRRLGNRPVQVAGTGEVRVQTDPQRTLSAAGRRWTNQRQHVLDVLREAQTHLDASQVY